MIYRTEVWLNNKITVVVGDECELYEKELARLKELGGVVLAKYAQENELENVIVCSKKGATAVTAADKKAELVTHICKECQKHDLTLEELMELLGAVKRFYYQNARP